MKIFEIEIESDNQKNDLMKDSVQNLFKSIKWLPQYRHTSRVIQESNHKCSKGEHINNTSNIQKKEKEN